MSLEIGDRVRIKETIPNPDAAPGFVLDMEKYLGKETVVEYVYSSNGWVDLADTNRYTWHQDWVEPILPTPENPTPENRGLDLLMGTPNDGVVGGWDYLQRR